MSHQCNYPPIRLAVKYPEGGVEVCFREWVVVVVALVVSGGGFLGAGWDGLSSPMDYRTPPISKV